MSAASSRCREKRIPEWLKSGLPDAHSLGAVRSEVSDLGLSTICFEARCPNKRICFERRSVSFLVLGRHCTRNCMFCNVEAAPPDPVDQEEPEKLRQAALGLGLTYVVVTSVTRDDLPDGGASHLAACARSLKGASGAPAVELLTPDFRGSRAAVEQVCASGTDVFAHNLETVERLYPIARSGACYARSLRVLEHARNRFDSLIVKSGLIVGIGETIEEVKTTIEHLAGAGCDIVTVGQYMRPSRAHLPVAEYLEPEVFQELGDLARRLGMVPVCGPRVRSSFLAEPAFCEAKSRRQKCA
jgi:lipoic acid synthetase